VNRSSTGMSFTTRMLLTVASLVIIASTIGLAVGVSNNQDASSSQSQSSSSGSGSDAMAQRESSFEQVVTYMANSGVSTFTALSSPGTPQNRAAHWMAEMDKADIAVPELAVTTLAGYKYMSRYILAVFYLSMGGQNWNFQANFMTIESICQWNQVLFDGDKFYRQGVLCDTSTGLIFALDLGKWISDLPPQLKWSMPSRVCS
jgi:hypothetical protein